MHHGLITPPFTQNGGTTTVDSGQRLTVGNPCEPTDPGLIVAAGTLDRQRHVVSAHMVTNTGGIVAPSPGSRR